MSHSQSHSQGQVKLHFNPESGQVVAEYVMILGFLVSVVALAFFVGQSEYCNSENECATIYAHLIESIMLKYKAILFTVRMPL